MTLPAISGPRTRPIKPVALPIAALTTDHPTGIGGVDSLEFSLKVKGGVMAQERAFESKG